MLLEGVWRGSMHVQIYGEEETKTIWGVVTSESRVITANFTRGRGFTQNRVSMLEALF